MTTEQQTYSRLEITNVDFEIKGLRLYVSYTDGRDNDRQKDYLVSNLYNWMVDNLSIPYTECRHYAHHYITQEHIKRFIQYSKIVKL